MSSEATTGQTPDAYGQVHPVETPELLERKFEEFQVELDKLPIHEKVHLTEAQTKCPDLLTDDFKLMFLRCEVFNSDLAAKRYCSYWTKRVDIFGPDRAFLPLTLGKGGALHDDDVQTAFSMGVMTLLQQIKDPKGRSVIYLDPSRLDKTKYTTMVLVRTYWYVIHAALEDEDTQKHGLIILGNPGRAKLSQFDRSVTKIFLGSLKGALPVRLSALHVVHPPVFASVIWPIVNVFMGERIRKRVRFHSGKDEKVLEELEKRYGLSKEMLPTTIGGTIEVRHMEWLQTRSSSGL